MFIRRGHWIQPRGPLLPPEALAAKLVLEHREDWLRNPSTCLSARFTQVFRNPLGHQTRDGIFDANLTAAIGGFAAGWQMQHGGGVEDMVRGIGQIGRMLIVQ